MQERYDVGASVIYYDALRRQSSITFGELPGGEVSILEADEKLFKASLHIPGDAEGEGGMKEKELRAAVFKFARSKSSEFKFPSTLTKAQRHIVHVAAQQKGLLHATVGNPCAIVLRKNITESASPEVSVVDGVSTPRKMAAQSDPAGTPEKIVRGPAWKRLRRAADVVEAPRAGAAASSSADPAVALHVDEIAGDTVSAAANELLENVADTESDDVWDAGGLDDGNARGASTFGAATSTSTATTGAAVVDRRNVVWHCLPYVGVMERLPRPGPWGERPLFLRSCGVTKSVRRKRLPPLLHATWAGVLAEMRVNENTRAVLMSDGGDSKVSAYAAVESPAFIKKMTVDHGRHEYACKGDVPCRVLEDGRVESLPGMLGVQVMERTWRTLKKYVPRELKASNDVCLELCIREGQWHVFLRPGQEWQSFCAASARLSASLEADAVAIKEGRFSPESLLGRVYNRLSKKTKCFSAALST